MKAQLSVSQDGIEVELQVKTRSTPMVEHAMILCTRVQRRLLLIKGKVERETTHHMPLIFGEPWRV